MYDLLEYSKNYLKTSRSLWNYYTDEPNSGTVGNTYYSIKDSKSFDYKTSITGKLGNNNVEKEYVEIVVPLKYLTNFWGTLYILLINCQIFLTLTWSKNYVVTSQATRDANPAVAAVNNRTGASFKIIDRKLYAPVITLSAKDDNKLLEELYLEFKRTIKWNKSSSEMTTQTETKNLNYLIDHTFTKANRLFALSFENEDQRISFLKYFVPSVEIYIYMYIYI